MNGYDNAKVRAVIVPIAQKYGVEMIWVDLETIGKEERQKGPGPEIRRYCG